MSKKLISVLITAILIISVAPLAFAAGGGVAARLDNVKTLSGYRIGTPEYNCYLFAGRVFTQLFEYDSSPNINYHGDYDSNNHNTMLIGREYTSMSCSVMSCRGTDPVSEEAKALTIGKVNIENTRTLLSRAMVGDIFQGHRGDGVHTMIIQSVNFENEVPISLTVYHGNWNSAVTVTTFTVEELVKTYDHAMSVFRSKNYYLIDSGTSIYFNAEGGSATYVSKFVDGGAKAGPMSVATRPGYTFDGWYTSEIGGSKFSEDMVPTESTLNLYAHWSPESYNVTFDAAGGSSEKASKSVTFGGKYGSLPDAERKGYKFAGWSTKADDKDTVSANTAVSTFSDHTLFAQWVPNKYTIEFDPTSGVLKADDRDVLFGLPYGELPTPVNPGYLFTGWSTDKEGNNIVDGASAVAMAEDHTLFATWVPLFTGRLNDLKITSENNHEIKLAWSETPLATGYEIYRAENIGEEGKKLAVVDGSSSTSYTDTGCVEGKFYYYTVRAYQLTGKVTQYSPMTDSTKATTLFTVPETPEKFKAGSSAATYVSLSWSSVSKATGYEVMRSTSPDGPFVTLYVTPNNSTTNTGCEPGTTYYYKIAAICTVSDSVGRSPLTAAVEAATKAQ
ncbi:MAG: InlB B-repeat-containing protein [Oscillospiraceae bacterium]